MSVMGSRYNKGSLLSLAITPTSTTEFVIPVRRRSSHRLWETNSIHSGGMQAGWGAIYSPRQSLGGNTTSSASRSSSVFSDTVLGVWPAQPCDLSDELRRRSQESTRPLLPKPIPRHLSPNCDHGPSQTRTLRLGEELSKWFSSTLSLFSGRNSNNQNTLTNKPPPVQSLDPVSSKQASSRTASDETVAADIPQTTKQHVDLETLAEETKEKSKPEASAMISLDYNPYAKTLTCQIRGLWCADPKGASFHELTVELTLPSGTQRRGLSVPKAESTGKRQSKAVVFEEVKAAELSYGRLKVRVHTKKMARKRGQLLCQTCRPLYELPLTGDAILVPLETVNREDTGCLTICMSYLTQRNKLVVTVAKANALRKSTLPTATWVEVNFLRGSGERSEIQKARTKVRYGGNPVFKEAFAFALPCDSLTAAPTEVTFTVRRRNLVTRGDSVLGRVTLSSEMFLRWKKSQSLAGTLDEVFRYPGKVVTQTHRLCHET